VIPEVENRNKPGGCCGASVGFDPAANADAHHRVEQFFGRHLGPR
jgi:dienelactone hydrolase